MVVPGLLAVTMPIAVGLVFRMFGIGAEAVAAFLMVGTIAGILMAPSSTTAAAPGITPRNTLRAASSKAAAKVRSAQGRGRRRYLGDPFKDTAGPSLARLDQDAGDDHAGVGALVCLRIRFTKKASPARGLRISTSQVLC